MRTSLQIQKRERSQVEGSAGSVGSRTLSESLPGPRDAGAAASGSGPIQLPDGLRAVQCKGDVANDAGVLAAAEHGIGGGGGALPFHDTIQAAFGHHDLGDVRAHTGSAAVAANAAMGAEAYATGNDIAFGTTPTLHTAAHEAAHVVQQRGGVAFSGGVGAAGDRYEQHADQVADAVVAGRSAAGLLDEMAGTPAVQRRSVQRRVVQRRTLQEITHGRRDSAMTELSSLLGSEAGIVARQKRAVTEFCAAVAIEDQPTVVERILIGAINVALGMALDGIKVALQARLGGAAAAVATTATTGGTPAPSIHSEAGMDAIGDAMGDAAASAITVPGAAGARSYARECIGAIIGAGKSSLSTAVQNAFTGAGQAMPTPALQFQHTQLNALDTVGIEQHLAMVERLSALSDTEVWPVMNELFVSFQGTLDRAYREQWNQTNDTWFTMQASRVGLGGADDAPIIGGGTGYGVLQIEIGTAYPDQAGLHLVQTDFYGPGTNATIRGALAQRALQDIGIPKVIRMNGSMGMGVLDCDWHMTVTGETARPSGPSVSAGETSADPVARYLTGGEQHVTAVGGNRWGPAWLAAHHLRVHDLATDDARNNEANQAAGARAVWETIKAHLNGNID